MTCCVEQGHYGHFSNKRTWLYAVRCELPELNWTAGEQRLPPEMIERYGYKKARRIGLVAMIGGKDKTKIRNATPPAFAAVLVAMAQSVGALGFSGFMTTHPKGLPQMTADSDRAPSLITRFRLYYNSWDNYEHSAFEAEDPDGEWVRHSDHAAEIARLVGENGRLRAALGEIVAVSRTPVGGQKHNAATSLDAKVIARRALDSAGG